MQKLVKELVEPFLIEESALVGSGGVIAGAPDPKKVKKVRKQLDKDRKKDEHHKIEEFIGKPKMKRALSILVKKKVLPKSYATNISKLQHFLTNNPMVMTQLLRLLGEKVNEAFAVRGSKVEKFITGKNLTHKGRKYKEIEFETIKVDNPKKMVTLRILAPKNLFGQEVPVRFQTLRRGPFLKTDTGKKLNNLEKNIKWMNRNLKSKKLLVSMVVDFNHLVLIIKKRMNG